MPLAASSAAASNRRPVAESSWLEPAAAAAVVIVNYKAYDELKVCLASLAPSLRPGDEVFVLDNESDSRALNEATRDCPGVSTIRCPDNLGFAAGVNLAVARSRAPYLLLLNPDTIVRGPLVQALADWLTSHPDVGVVAPRVLNRDGSVQATARRFPNVTTVFGGRSTWLTRRFPDNWLSRWNLPARHAESPTDVDWVSGACFMTRRELFERLGGFDEHFFLYWEDADYCRRAADVGARRTYLPGVSVSHIGGCSSRRSPARSIRAFHRSAHLLFKQRASWWERPIVPLARLALWLRGEWQVWVHVPRTPSSPVKPVVAPRTVGASTADVGLRRS